MARTTAELIAAIIELDDTISLVPFIAVANALVTEVCVPAGYDDERLTLIETWLAAHFYTVRVSVTTSESVSGVSESKQLWTGPHLQASEYGQTAMTLDTAGGLNLLNERSISGKGKQKAIIATLMTNADRAYYGADRNPT